MKLNLIVAVDNQFGIGLNNKLPWKNKADLAYFKKITHNSTVIMGRNTWESLPIKPLPGRENIIMTRNPNFTVSKPDTTVISQDDILADKIKKTLNPIFIIGGHDIYHYFLKFYHNRKCFFL